MNQYIIWSPDGRQLWAIPCNEAEFWHSLGYTVFDYNHPTYQPQRSHK